MHVGRPFIGRAGVYREQNNLCQYSHWRKVLRRTDYSFPFLLLMSAVLIVLSATLIVFGILKKPPDDKKAPV